MPDQETVAAIEEMRRQIWALQQELERVKRPVGRWKNAGFFDKVTDGNLVADQWQTIRASKAGFQFGKRNPIGEEPGVSFGNTVEGGTLYFVDQMQPDVAAFDGSNAQVLGRLASEYYDGGFLTRADDRILLERFESSTKSHGIQLGRFNGDNSSGDSDGYAVSYRDESGSYALGRFDNYVALLARETAGPSHQRTAFFADTDGSNSALTSLGGALNLHNVVSPSQITSNQNNYNPTGNAGATWFRINSDAAREITGWVPSYDGEIKMVHNVGSFTITFKDESGSSTAANRFALTSDLDLAADAIAMFMYDATSSRWRGGLIPASTSGTTTIDGSNAIIAVDSTLNEIVSTSSETTLWSFTIPGGTLSTDRMARITITGDYLNNSGSSRTIQFKTKFDGTTEIDDTTPSISTDANRRPFRMIVEISAQNSATVQFAHQEITLGPEQSTVAGIGDWWDFGGETLGHWALHAWDGTTSVDTGSDVAVAITVQHSASSSSLSLRRHYAVCELVAPNVSGSAGTNVTLDSGTFSAVATVVSPSQITADQNNYSPTGFVTGTMLRLSTDASRNITGLVLAAGSNITAAIAVIHNVGSFNIVLQDENASSTAGNRFALTGDITIAPDQVCVLQYDGTTSRWRGGLLLASAASASEAYVTIGNTAGLSAERALAVGSPLTLTDGGAGASVTLDFDETVTLGNNARVAVRKNSGAVVGTRRQLNFIEGSNVTLTIADDAGSEEVDITIAASGGGGGGASATTVEVNLGSTATWRGKFTITDAAIGATNKVHVWQAPGPYTGKGTRADEAEMQPVKITAVEPAAGSATVYWETPPLISMNSVVPGGRRDAPSTAAGMDARYMDIPRVPVRLGKVRGNVKFSYVIFS